MYEFHRFNYVKLSTYVDTSVVVVVLLLTQVTGVQKLD